MSDKADLAGVVAVLPSLPRDDDGPVFREPWEAQAFAMTLALYRRGLFTWSEWAAALAAEIKRAQTAGDPDTGETYYQHWLAALERLVTEKGIADPATLTRYRDAWDHAADRTPHGTPIELTAEDFAPLASSVSAAAEIIADSGHRGVEGATIPELREEGRRD